MEDNFEDAEGAETLFTDENGLTWNIPKAYNYDTIANYENEDVKKYFELTPEIINGSCAVTQEMRDRSPEVYVNYGGNYKNSNTRQIINPIEDWTDQEREDVEAFLKFCSDKGGIPGTKEDCFRFLQAKNWDMEGGYQAMLARKEKFDTLHPFTITEKCQLLVHLGNTYICGRDKDYRPICVIQPRVAFQMDPPPTIEEVLGATSLVQQFVFDHMHQNGKIEVNTMILDMTGLNVFTINYTLLKGIIGYTGSVWRGRGRNFFQMNTPTTFSILYKVISPFMDQSQQAKMQITSGNSNENLNALCHPSQLPECVGGQQPNREPGEYWPPRIPTDNFMPDA